MNTIDYNKLIDPLCIPVIKELRENKGINTLFCCQGRSKEDTKEESHSIRGYITAEKTKESVDLFLKLYELELTRYPFISSRKSKFVINPKSNTVAFYLPARRFETKKELEEEWNAILSEIKCLGEVTVYVDKEPDGTFSLSPDPFDPLMNYGLVGEGATPEEAIEDWKKSYEDMKALYKKNNKYFAEVKFNYILNYEAKP